MKPIRTIILLLTIFILSGCNQGGENKSSASPPALASVNGQAITRAQFDAFLKFKRIPDDDPKRLQTIQDQYLEREALASVISDEDLLDRELTQAELNEFRKEMLISRYFEKYLKQAVSDQGVQNYYNTHAGDYEERKAHAAHILIRTNKKMSEPERMARLTRAQEAYSQIRSGKDFAQIAKDYSEDSISAKKGGDLGWLKEGSIDPRFSKTVFEMEPGAVSEPFETAFGFHIVKLLDGPEVVKRPFESVAGDIRSMLRNQAKKAEMDRLMARARIVKD